MFDQLKGMAGMAGLLKDLPRIKQQMEDVRDRLAEMVVEAETGGGAVRVTANGTLKILTIEVDHTLLGVLIDVSSPDDKALAEDLVTGAVNAALTRAREEAAEQEFATVAQELGLPIPPGALGGLLG